MVAAIVVGLFAFVPSVLAGDGITIDFDSGKGGNPDTYKENGVKVKTTSGGSVRVNNYDGDADKELRGGQYSFSAGGQRFTVKTIRIVEYGGNSQFTSSAGDTTSANQPDPYTKKFSGDDWKKIKSFEWTNTENSTIDDIEIILYDKDGEIVEEPVLPADCGRSPYKPWADQPAPYKFERKFWQPCRNVSGDENDTLYHGLFLPQAIEAGLQLGG
jgi:hypothetical protein